MSILIIVPSILVQKLATGIEILMDTRVPLTADHFPTQRIVNIIGLTVVARMCKHYEIAILVFAWFFGHSPIGMIP